MKTKTHFILPVIYLAAAISVFGQPRFTVQPTNQMVAQGFSVTLRAVAATASPPLAYQWYFNSSAVAGALTNVLNIDNAQATNSGEYFAMATDSIGSVTSKLATLTVILPALLNPKVGPNIRLGDDSPALPASRRAQTETHLARSWTDPNLLIATCMEGVTSSGFLGCSYSVSTNGGQAWSPRTLTPKLTTLSGGTAPYAGDPIAGIDATGNLFVSALTVNATVSKSLELLISKSSDVGASFAAPVQIFRSDAKYWGDKDSFAINTFPDSPTFNRIVVVFTGVPSNPPPGDQGQLLCTHSDDGGTTWSEPALVGSLFATWAQPLFFRDGSLAVLYEWFDPKALTNCLNSCVLSKDGGLTFGQRTLAMDLTGLNYEVPKVFAYSDFSACSDRQAGVLYMTAAVAGPSASQLPRVLFTKSIDKGQSWTQPIPVTDTPGGASVFQPTIAASPDGQHVSIAFYDKRNSAGDNYLVDYYLAESFDGGDTWEPNLRLSEFTMDLRKSPPFVGDVVWLGDYQGLVPALNFDTPAVATWIDTRAGNNDPYSVRIRRTKGTTFDTWRKLRFSTNDLADARISGENADPDGDGIANVAEYALGLEPNKADDHPFQVTFRTSAANPMIDLTYEILSVSGDVASSWEESTNLLNWMPIKPQMESISNGRNPWMERFNVSFSGSSQKKFFRLRLTLVNPTP